MAGILTPQMVQTVENVVWKLSGFMGAARQLELYTAAVSSAKPGPYLLEIARLSTRGLRAAGVAAPIAMTLSVLLAGMLAGFVAGYGIRALMTPYLTVTYYRRGYDKALFADMQWHGEVRDGEALIGKWDWVECGSDTQALVAALEYLTTR